MIELEYLEGPELRDALVSACDAVQAHRAELNRINVFPVPDGDTGTNLALTAAAIADHLRPNRDESVSGVMRAAAEAAVLGARGNCGMILSHFLLGFSEALGDETRIGVQQFGAALRHAVGNVYQALERPVEGTIITIMRSAAERAEQESTDHFPVLMAAIVEAAREALARTPDLLPALKAAGVVDAGAKGFVHLLEGLKAHLSGEVLAIVEPSKDQGSSPFAAAVASYPTASERYRFCTEALVRGPALPDAEVVRAVLRERGDSMVVIRTAELLKVHIHTDEPEQVFGYLGSLGELAAHKSEDMQAQHEAVGRAAAAGHLQLARRPGVVLSDSACDLPEEVVRAHGIQIVPLSLIFGDEVLRDRIDITATEFAQRMQDGVFATTSQPTPAAFLEGYRRAAEDGEAVLAVTLAASLSGTHANAEAAAKIFPDVPVHVVNSRGASLNQGLLALRAAELLEQGWAVESIAPELSRVRDGSGLLFTLDTYDRLLASGRVGRGRALLGKMLDIKPILGLDVEGNVEPVARVRGRRNVLPRMLEILAERIPKDARRVRFGIIQVAAEEIAREVAEALRARFGAREILTSSATPVIATHTGPGTWGVAYQVED